MPPGWAGTRARILDRDRHTCQDCGQPATIVDHIQARCFGGTDDDWNLQSLCPACSASKTAAEAAAARGLLRDSPARPAQLRGVTGTAAGQPGREPRGMRPGPAQSGGVGPPSGGERP